MDPSQGLKSWSTTTPEGYKSMVAVFDCEAEMNDILTVINVNNKYRNSYDPTFDSSMVLERYDRYFQLTYTKIKRVSIVAPRDFIIFLAYHCTNDGVVDIICFQDD